LIKIWEGNKTGRRSHVDGKFQMNQVTAGFLDEVKVFFPDTECIPQYNLIIASI
jgi:hypothetical protein